MSPRLTGRIAIVTGSSSGYGRAIALRYAEEGAAAVVCADSSPEAARAGDVPTHVLIQNRGRKSFFVDCDMRKEAEVERLVEYAVLAFGRLDIMVNASGILPDDVVENPGDSIHETRGMFLGCKYAITQFLAQEPLPNVEADSEDAARGWVVNVADARGLGGSSRSAAYTRAVVALTKQLSQKYAQELIHVNALCPNARDTPSGSPVLQAKDADSLPPGHPWMTAGIPEDVSRAAMLFASHDAQYIMGA